MSGEISIQNENYGQTKSVNACCVVHYYACCVIMLHIFVKNQNNAL